MECQFIEQISLLIDGELNEADARQIRAHLATCAVCQQAQADFLSLRQAVQAAPHAPDAIAQQRTLTRILTNERTPLWRRKIAMPAPAFALLMLAFVALSFWMVASRINPAPQTGVQISPPSRREVTQNAASAFDLSKFDRGERAVIYTSPRPTQ
ncbi:MAG: zf-HC2 domain-containing protein [Acidobacteriota bacterium]